MLELGSHALRDLARSEKQIHGDEYRYLMVPLAFAWLLLIFLGSFPCFHLQHGFTYLIVFCWLLACICSNFDQSNMRVTIWIHFVRCMGIGDGRQSIETCWSYMSNPVQLCFHNSMPDKYLRSQYQCHKKGEHSKTSQTCAAFFIFQRRATVLVTLKKNQNSSKKTNRVQESTNNKNTAPLRVSCNMWRVAPHVSPMFSRVYQPRRSIAPWIRGVASEIAASETTSSLLSQIQGDGNDGKVQSCTGGLLRLQLGPLFF